MVLSVCFRVTELAFTRELSAKLTDEAKCQREVNRRRWWLFFFLFFSFYYSLSAAAVCFERDDDQRCVCVCPCACVHGADSSRSMMKRKRTRAHSSLYFMLRSVCSCCCFVSLCVCGLQQYKEQKASDGDRNQILRKPQRPCLIMPARDTQSPESRSFGGHRKLLLL